MKKIVLILILIIFISGCTAEIQTQELTECTTDADCVPATCCHPNECIPKAQAPDCTGIMCTMECKPGTMDCGQGHCACQANKCVVIFT